ncbi:MAG: 16S rRNA (guanine(527)-N(7))-methyltransferase RsmG [Rhizobiaceae bacterium]
MKRLEAQLEEIGVDSRETLQRLAVYEHLLRLWQAKTNLVANNTLDRFWDRHVGDSLQCLDLRRDEVAWVDLGSGGGFPGMVIAIACAASGWETTHTLIEANQKKCAFLRTVARETNSPCRIVNERIESASKQLKAERFGTITARALAPLAELLRLARPMMKPGTVALFHKGREFEREIEECRGLWSFDLVIHKSRIESGSVLLEITNPVANPA